MNNYLTEKRLVELVKKLIPNCELIVNKTVPNSSIQNRPDIRCEEFKIIIEFDGYLHYNNAKTQSADIIKDFTYSKMGYKVIHIPYFIQASKEIILKFLNENYFDIPKNLDAILIEYQYPHGFIDDKALLPADYNEYGIELFQLNLLNFWYVTDDIVESLENKINKLCFGLCLPEQLEYLITNKELRKNISAIKLCDSNYDLSINEKKIAEVIEKYNKKELRRKKLERILKKCKKK